MSSSPFAPNYQIEHEKAADDNPSEEIDPISSIANSIICIVQHIGPSLHSDAYEDVEHGVSDVVERSDAVVRSFPFRCAHGTVRTHICTQRGIIDVTIDMDDFE